MKDIGAGPALAVVTLLVGLALGGFPSAAWAFDVEATRSGDLVTVDGNRLSRFQDVQISRLGLFRYDPSSGGYEPIPFQLDERIDRVFNPGTDDEFTERIAEKMRGVPVGHPLDPAAVIGPLIHPHHLDKVCS